MYRLHMDRIDETICNSSVVDETLKLSFGCMRFVERVDDGLYQLLKGEREGRQPRLTGELPSKIGRIEPRLESNDVNLAFHVARSSVMLTHILTEACLVVKVQTSGSVDWPMLKRVKRTSCDVIGRNHALTHAWLRFSIMRLRKKVRTFADSVRTNKGFDVFVERSSCVCSSKFEVIIPEWHNIPRKRCLCTQRGDIVE